MKKIYTISRSEDNIIEPDIFCIQDKITQGLTEHIENKWEPVNLKWIDNITDPKFDFIFIYGYIPVCNENAYLILSQMPGLNNVYFLPIIIDNEKYYIISVLQIEKSILNRKKSKIEYFTDKRPKIRNLFKRWGQYVYYRYYPDTNNEAIDKNEVMLIRAIKPDFNEEIPDKLEPQLPTNAF